MLALKTFVKGAAAGALYYTGLLRRIPRPPLTVLGYHRVLADPLEHVTSSPLGMVASAQVFERQITYVATRYRMISLQELEETSLAERPLPPRACLVTFDDGWRDNYTIAYPILRRLGIPAAVFITTDYIGTQKRFWFTTLMQCLLARPAQPLRPGMGRELAWPPDVSRELDRLASRPRPLRPWQLDGLVEAMKNYPETSIQSMVAALERRVDGLPPLPRDEALFLSWEQVCEMDRHGIGIGSHSCTHRILTQLGPDEAHQELRRSRERLEQELGHPVMSFAFPNGDYTADHMTMAWEVGYRLFFVSSRVHPGTPTGRVFPRPCVHDRVGQGPLGGFAPSLLEFHLAGVRSRMPRWLTP